MLRMGSRGSSLDIDFQHDIEASEGVILGALSLQMSSCWYASSTAVSDRCILHGELNLVMMMFRHSKCLLPFSGLPEQTNC